MPIAKFDPQRLHMAEYRYAQYYLTRLQTFTDVFHGRNVHSSEIQTQFEEDWTQIQRGQAWSARRLKDHRAAALCSAYAIYTEFGADLLSLRQPLPERIQWLHSALDAAIHLQDQPTELKHKLSLSDAYLNSGKLDDAKGYSEKTLELAQLLKDSHGAAHALIGLADVYYEMGEYEQARQYLNDAQTLTNDSLLIVKIYKLLGNIASIYGESAKAVEYYQQTLEISRQSGNKLGVAHSLNNLGVEAYLAGDYRRAAEYYHESRLLCMEVGDLNNVALALNNLGNIAGYIEGEDALNYYQEALAIFSRMGRRWGEALVHGNIGRTLELSGDPRAACPHYETSVAICEEIGDKYGLCDALCNLAFAHIIEGDSDAARKELHQGLQLAQELEVDNALHHAIIGYARLFIADSCLQQAAELLGIVKVQLGDDIDIETRVRLDPVIALLEGALPAEELTAIFVQSKSLNLNTIVACLLNADEQIGSNDA